MQSSTDVGYTISAALWAGHVEAYVQVIVAKTHAEAPATEVSPASQGVQAVALAPEYGLAAHSSQAPAVAYSPGRQSGVAYTHSTMAARDTTMV